MHIALATDRNYLEFAGVALRSLVQNGGVPEAAIIVCADSLTANDKAQLSQCTAPRKIQFVDLEGAARERISRLSSAPNWPKVVYSRVLLPELLAHETGRLLYIDCDVVITKSVRPLFEMEIGDSAVAAVPAAKSDDFIRDVNARLGLPSSTPYFNSGVMLMHLPRWREQGLTQSVLDFAANNPDRLKYYDQDALNAAIQGDFVKLDSNWNCYGQGADCSSAAIIHYVHDKPNRANSNHPARHVYLQLRAQTPWANKRRATKWNRRWNKLKRKLLSLPSSAA